MSNWLIRADGVKKHFRRGRNNGMVHAVENAAFCLGRGKTLGLVGESGSGKTTLGMSILKLVEPTGGRCMVRFDGDQGEDLFRLSGESLRRNRKHMQIIFQNPNAAINPRSMKVKGILKEAIEVRCEFNGMRPERVAVEEEALDKLKLVRLGEGKLDRYPFELSGGEKRRVILARALCIEPEFIVTDEITADLDGSTSVQILNLMKELQERKELTYLFISHDLAHVIYMSHWIAVMLQGRIVEIRPTLEILEDPKHEYTKELFSQLSEFDAPGCLEKS